jgi:hypothetical protein
VGVYTGIAANCKWRCEAGHTFTAKMAVLRGKKEPCTECGLAKFAEANGLQLLTAWTQHSGPTTPLTWRCLACETVFTASQAALGRKKRLCPQCP